MTKPAMPILMAGGKFGCHASKQKTNRATQRAYRGQTWAHYLLYKNPAALRDFFC